MKHNLILRSLLGLSVVMLLLMVTAPFPAAASSVPTAAVFNGSLATQPLAPNLTATIWAGWQNLGKVNGYKTESVAIGQNQDGHLEMLTYAWYGSGIHDHAVYRRNQTAVNGTSWTAWAPLGTLEPGTFLPSVIKNPAGRLEVFANADVTNAGTCQYRVGMKQIYQIAPNAGWSSWGNLGLPSGLCKFYQPYVGMNGDGRLDLFAQGDDHIYYHRWQTSPSGNWNTTWTSIGTLPSGAPVQDMAVGNNADGRIALFTYNFEGEFFHAWQNTANDETGWSSWTGFGKPSGVSALEGPSLAQNSDGRLDVFGRGYDGNLWHKWQVAPNSYWSSWGSLGHPSSAYVYFPPKAIQMSDGRLTVFIVGGDGAMYLIAQTQASGSWGNWTSLSKPSGTKFGEDIAIGRNQNGGLVIAAADTNGNLWWNYEQFLVPMPVLTTP